MIIVVIMGVITLISFDLLLNKIRTAYFVEFSSIEVWWTVIPGIILLFIAYPSLRLLYLIDEVEEPALTVAVTGHQWYWEYQLPEVTVISYESYMSSDQIDKGSRLIEAGNVLCLPIKRMVRVLVSASDVAHS